MKVALCLYGHLGLKSLASARTSNSLVEEAAQADKMPRRSIEGLQRTLLDKYDTDVFIHSWSADKGGEIKDHYAPKKALVETQTKFDCSLTPYGITDGPIEEWKISQSSKYGYELMLAGRPTMEAFKEALEREAFRSKSRWYSSQQSIQLKQKYELEHDFRYDFVLVSRFDCIFVKPFHLENLDRTKFYGTPRSGRSDVDDALQDFWFMSNSPNMDKFSSLYNHIHEYCIRPTFACRQHAESCVGKDKIAYLLKHNVDYMKE